MSFKHKIMIPRLDIKENNVKHCLVQCLTPGLLKRWRSGELRLKASSGKKVLKTPISTNKSCAWWYMLQLLGKCK
jgi:hypothetical protein